MFQKHSENGYTQAIPGIEKKTLVFGEKTLMTEFVLQKGSLLPLHSHPHEQTGYLVKGHIRLSIGPETVDVTPGDSWNIPGGAEHGAEILEDSVAIEVFSPVREDYLPKEEERSAMGKSSHGRQVKRQNQDQLNPNVIPVYILK